MRVLLVEDDVALASATARGLAQSGFAVDVAHDGEAAIEKAGVTAYDVVVLDRDLPRMHGDEVCRRLAGGPSRVLLLTAMGTLDDRVAGLELGADDYLAKPHELRELVARVRALGRRPAAAVAPVLEFEGLVLDTARFLVTRDGSEVVLARKEFGVLEVLMRVPGAPVSAEELLERVWDEHADPFTNAVRVVMVTLRRKLGEPCPIETVKGVGYRLRSVR